MLPAAHCEKKNTASRRHSLDEHLKSSGRTAGEFASHFGGEAWARLAATWRMSPRAAGIFVEDDRQQRAGLFLRDVAYTIHAVFKLTARAGADDNVGKFARMFLDRAGTGQCFHRPYLGTREFAAEFALVARNEPDPPIVSETRDLGWMLLDIVHDASRDEGHVHSCGPGCGPRFFNAALANGGLVEKGRDRLPECSEEGVRG